ncbi:hypothetical protein V8E51_012981 [Hyaloscypha variabilis]
MSRDPEAATLLTPVEPPAYDGGCDITRQQDGTQYGHRVRKRSNVKPAAIRHVSSSEILLKSRCQLYSDLSRQPPEDSEGDTWEPGARRRLPYRGVLALLGCLGCIAISFIVLVKSNGQPTSSWTLSPAVYIALATTGTNMLARYAFKEGMRIAWWRRALRGGTVRDLHDHWAHANGFWSAIFACRRTNLVTLASLSVTAMIIDQPLIQRASSIASITKTSPVNVTAPIAPEIPWGYTGWENGRVSGNQVMTQPMISVFNDYNRQAPIITTFSGCNGTCTGWVDAGGLAATCNTTSFPITVEMSYDTLAKPISMFGVSFNFPGPVMTVAYTNNSNSNACSGTRTERACLLLSATLRYPITLTGNIVTIGDVLNDGSTKSFQPLAPYDWYPFLGGDDFSFWTLGGLYVAASSLFSSNATYTFEGGIGFTLSIPDILSTQFLEFPSENVSGIQGIWNLTRPESCGCNWTDPTSYILTALNTMAFRLSLSAAHWPYRNTSTSFPPQLLAMNQTSTLNVYRSDFRFLVANTILTLAFIMLIVPTFIGWWELGRTVTLDPIEIAKAFDAPLLRGPGSNAPLEKLVKTMGGREVSLGEADSDAVSAVAKKQLKLANPVEVAMPRAGAMYE